MRRLKIVVVQVAIAWALLEIALHIYQPIPFRVRGESIILPVRQRYVFDNPTAKKLDRVVHHTKNSLGFRGPEPPRDLAAHLSIVTIGGSTTEGLFISDGRTWTDAMARELAPDFPGLWVNNAGLDGQSTHGHLVLLRTVIVPLHPRVAVFLVGTNDVGLDAPNPYDEALTPHGSPVRLAARWAAEQSEVIALVRNLVRAAQARHQGFGHSEIDLAQTPDVALDAATVDATLAKYRAGLPGFRSRLQMLAETCRASGIEPVFVTQPALFGAVTDVATGVDLTFKQVNGRGNGDLEWRLLEQYNDVTRAVAADRGVWLVDLARQLPKDSRLFYDFIHFTNEGGAAVGRIVANGLRAHLARH